MKKSEYRFGVEIECFYPYKFDNEVRSGLAKLNCDPTCDGSIRPPDNCTDIEIRTPILEEAEVVPFFIALEKLFKKYKVKANTSCGLHVHVSNNRFFKERNMKHINLTWLAIEDVLFTLQNKRRMYNEYCEQKMFDYIKQNGLRQFGKCKDDYNYNSSNLRLGDRDALNFNSMFEHGTIECRAHTGTTDVERILNWVYLLHKFYDYSLNNYNAKTIEQLFSIPCSSNKAGVVWKLLNLDKKRKAYFEKAVNSSIFEPLNRQREVSSTVQHLNSKIKWYKNRFKIVKKPDYYFSRRFSDGSAPVTMAEKRLLELEQEKTKIIRKMQPQYR